MSPSANGNEHVLLRRVGPLCVSFESSDAGVRERLSELYGAFEAVEEIPAADASVAVAIEWFDAAVGWRATVDGGLCRQSPHLSLVEEAVTRRINRLVLDAETDRLHLHAGAVASSDGVVLVVGTSGSGKSTLVTRLVADGWSYLSDEQMGVLEGGVLVPYPRPLTLRRPSWELLPGFVPDGLDDAIERYEIAPARLGGQAQRQPVAPDLIVTPDVGRSASSVEPLSAAEAVAALFEDTLDLERSGRPGFDRLLELATTAPMIRIAGTSLDATVQAVTAELKPARTAPGIVDHVVPVAGALVAPCARAWLFSDDTALIYDDESGSLAQLDRAGFAAWSALATEPGVNVPEQVRASSFVQELQVAGLVVEPQQP